MSICTKQRSRPKVMPLNENNTVMRYLKVLGLSIVVVSFFLAFFFGTIIYLLLQIVKLFCNDDRIFVI